MTTDGRVAWLNGRFLPLTEASVSPLDRGFLFADAVYEVLPVYDGKAYRLQQHLDRLDRSLQMIRMRPVMPRAAWLAICGGLVTRNGGGNLLLYLQVSRGAEAGRSHLPGDGLQPTVFGMASSAAPLPADAAGRGVSCITATDIRWSRCDIKTTALLANVLLKWQARDQGADEALLLRDGRLTEGASSSVHVVIGDVLVSPAQDESVLPGTTREVLIELAGRCGIATRTGPVAESELRNSSEIILGSAGGGLRAVTRLDGTAVGGGKPGPMFRRLYQAWIASIDEFCTRCPD